MCKDPWECAVMKKIQTKIYNGKYGHDIYGACLGKFQDPQRPMYQGLCSRTEKIISATEEGKGKFRSTQRCSSLEVSCGVKGRYIDLQLSPCMVRQALAGRHRSHRRQRYSRRRWRQMSVRILSVEVVHLRAQRFQQW